VRCLHYHCDALMMQALSTVKHQLICIRLHGRILQKTVIFRFVKLTIPFFHIGGEGGEFIKVDAS
jgi:hypothetical protein